MPTPDRHDLRAAGAVVRSFRRERHWSQQELGNRAKLSRGYISRLERGLAHLRITSLWALAEAFGIRPQDLAHAIDREPGGRKST
ncbi:MAG: Helix-turn-helix domain [Solirubrobacteraceae bacterium]|nr:Helix-turn-helix domain [Solirubrobacteraceae bacterium]